MAGHSFSLVHHRQFSRFVKALFHVVHNFVLSLLDEYSEVAAHPRVSTGRRGGVESPLALAAPYKGAVSYSAMLPLLPVRVALPCSFHPQQVRFRSCGNRLTGALPKCPVMWQACFGTPRPFLFEPALCVVPVLNSKCNEPQCRWNFPIKYPPCKTADQVNRNGERSPR